MNQHDLYIQTIDSIPSETLREYLAKHPDELSIMQMATVISYFSDSARTARLFRSLAKITQSPDEKALLRSAIKDLKNDGNIGEHTQSLYKKAFPHEGPPFFPFLEPCHFPILFNENDVIQCNGVTYTVKAAPVINDNSDFSDECYLCCPVAFYPECGAAHCQIHVCEAEKNLDIIRVETARSLFGVLSSDITLNEAKEERLRRGSIYDYTRLMII